jgi:hypothetical protein
MDAPLVDQPIVPLQPVDPPVTPQETVQVLGNADILAQISGRLPLREQQCLERVSRDVQQAVQEVGARREQRVHELTAGPRMQHLTLYARSRLQAPFVRSGFVPGLDYAPALAGAQTDVEFVTETLGDFAGVTPEQRRRDMFDRRWMALHTDEAGAARPHLVDRMGCLIDTGRSDQPAPGMARRRVPHTPYAQLARRGIQIVAQPVAAPRPAPGPPPATAPAA